jgi:hypothetical protein
MKSVFVEMDEDTACTNSEEISSSDCCQVRSKSADCSPESLKVTSESKLCCNCESTSVEYSCLDCPLEEKTYCHSCSEIHQKVKITRSHRIVRINDVKHLKSKVMGMTLRADSSTGNTTRNLVASEFRQYQRDISNSDSEKVSSKKFFENQQTERSTRSFSPRRSFAFMTNLCDVFFERCIDWVDFTDIIEMLTFFEFSVLLDDLPSSGVTIPIIGLLAIIITFSSGDLVTGAGSSVAILVAVTAFLRVMKRRKTMKQSHDPQLQKCSSVSKNAPLLRRRSSRTEKGGQFTPDRLKVKLLSIMSTRDDLSGSFTPLLSAFVKTILLMLLNFDFYSTPS